MGCFMWVSSTVSFDVSHVSVLTLNHSQYLAVTYSYRVHIRSTDSELVMHCITIRNTKFGVEKSPEDTLYSWMNSK